MRIYELIPDKVLADALNGALTVQTSATKSRKVKAYRQSDMPNTKLDDEFLTIINNGSIQSITYPVGVFRGNLAITLYCKANSNNTAKFNRIGSMLSQLQDLLQSKTYGAFHYEFNASNIITPINVNATTGYATTVVNVEWHTI